MLTEDGKHLYVSWDEYHNLIEKLAIKVHQSGWEFDQILCLARGGMRPGDVLSRIFDKPLAIMSTSSYRAEAGTIQGHLDIAKLHHHAQGRARRQACCWSTTWPIRASRCTRWSTGCAACRRSASCAPRCIWTKGVSTFTPDYSVETPADEPVDPSAVRGVRRPAARRTGEEVRHLMLNAALGLRTGNKRPAEAG